MLSMGGRVEFKTAINRITVDFGSFSLILPPPPPRPHSANSTPTAPNHLVASPSPHVRDVGSKNKPPPPPSPRPTTNLPPTMPLPSAEGCGQVLSCFPTTTATTPARDDDDREGGGVDENENEVEEG